MIAEGLSERVAPWLVTLDRSISAGGRLEQPLGYWNAMGALAAIGLVLCAGLAGDPGRPRALRAAAVAAAPLLGTAIALSFSRGALLCAGAGLVVLLLARPTRAQLASAAIAAAGAAAAGALAASLGGVKDPASASDGQGALLLAGIAGLGAGAAVAQLRLAGGLSGTLPVALRRAIAAAGAVAVSRPRPVARRRPGRRTGDPGVRRHRRRLASTQSNRYEYWDVALRALADHPVIGAGSGAFGVQWLRERTVAEGARDAHSLPLETLAELGLLGLLALAALSRGSCSGPAGSPPPPTPGAFGGMVAWAVHAAIDWAWEMPRSASWRCCWPASCWPQRHEQQRRGDARQHAGDDRRDVSSRPRTAAAAARRAPRRPARRGSRVRRRPGGTGPQVADRQQPVGDAEHEEHVGAFLELRAEGGPHQDVRCEWNTGSAGARPRRRRRTRAAARCARRRPRPRGDGLRQHPHAHADRDPEERLGGHRRRRVGTGEVVGERVAGEDHVDVLQHGECRERDVGTIVAAASAAAAAPARGARPARARAAAARRARPTWPASSRASRRRRR